MRKSIAGKDSQEKKKWPTSEVNIRVTREILGSHFVKWILTTYIKIVKLLVTMTQGDGCSFRGVFPVCSLVLAIYLASFPFGWDSGILLSPPKEHGGRNVRLTLVCFWSHVPQVVKVQWAAETLWPAGCLLRFRVLNEVLDCFTGCWQVIQILL